MGISHISSIPYIGHGRFIGQVIHICRPPHAGCTALFLRRNGGSFPPRLGVMSSFKPGTVPKVIATVDGCEILHHQKDG